MDKAVARAVALALAIGTYKGTMFDWASIFMCSDKYMVYIMNGQWPKEAKLGKEEVSTEA